MVGWMGQVLLSSGPHRVQQSPIPLYHTSYQLFSPSLLPSPSQAVKTELMSLARAMDSVILSHQDGGEDPLGVNVEVRNMLPFSVPF